MSSCARDYEGNVGSMFCYVVEGRNDADERWVQVSCYDRKADANNRLVGLKDGPYRDLRIMRRAC